MFLVSRAKSHLEQRSEELRHRSCAATLLRDAGCLLLLREDFNAGRKHLMQAGNHLLDTGLAAGLPLIAMYDAGRGREALVDYRKWTDEAARRTARAETDIPTDSREAIAASGRRSFRAMLSVVQTGMLLAFGHKETGLDYERRDSELRELDECYGGREVGETGLSVRRYLSLALSMATGASVTAREPPIEVVRAVELLGRHRAERIEDARRDEFHWRLVPRPAELLDLDAVVLIRIALAAGYEQDRIREWLGWGRGEIAGAPLDVAVRLKGFGRDRGPGLTL